MKINFKRVASVLASAIMLSSTIGFAAAASYPQPFVSGGTADSAVVVGANAAVSDWSAAIDLQQNLNGLVTTSSTSTGSTVTGEAAALFTGGTKLYINDSLNTVKSILTKSDLPTVLKDDSFSGNVDATVSQTIALGANPRITFEKQPSSSDDPNYALKTSVTRANYIYNATATFSKAINLTHADSKGQTLSLFGQTFTIASDTDATTLVLLKSAEKVSLDSDNPTAEVTVGGNVYTIELVSSSDTAATIKVTDSTGNSESKEISEAASKKVNGVTIAVSTADETNLKLSASIIVGAQKVKMIDGSEITTGDEDTAIDGAYSYLTGGPTAMTKLTVSVVAPESDKDAIKAGESFTDPVFGTFKLDFSGFNIPQDEANAARETIKLDNSGDDKMEITMTDHTGNEKTIMFAKNATTTFKLYADDDNRNFTVIEGRPLHYQDYVVVGNELEGHLLKLASIDNVSTGFSNDKVWFTDVFTGDSLKTTWISDGAGTVVIGGKAYDVTLTGASGIATEDYVARLAYADSITTGAVIIYPTIQTSKGAKLAFYQPETINLTSFDGTNTLTELKFPDGDGYTSVSAIRTSPIGSSIIWNFTTAAGVQQLNTTSDGASSFTAAIGELTYNFSSTANPNETKVMLVKPSGGNLDQPGIVIFEEKDDNTKYQALVVNLQSGRTSATGIGVSTIIDTWSHDSASWKATMPSNSKLEKSADLWGTIRTIDSTDSDQKTATISYPDEQMNAQLYVAEVSAAITPGTTTAGGGGQVVIVKDSEVTSVATKNLIVVGGSCINTAAAKILGSDVALCGADFTTKTGVGAGQYIIKTIVSPYAAEGSTKVAMLVAGYNAEDTVNAVAKAMEGAKSDAATEQVYPITTTATTTV